MHKSQEAKNSTTAQQKSKKPTQSDSNLHKSNKPTPSILKAPRAFITKQKSKKPNQTTTTRQNLPPMPTAAYVRLNEKYPRILHVKIASVMKGTGLVARLLEDLHACAFATGDMSKVVGKNHRGKPTLLWDEVLKYFSVSGNMVEKMVSWDEDDRWPPMVMFIERCQLDMAL
ncbi:373e5e5d-2afe-4e19-bacc-83646e8be347 [Sclerotinia trifoliorum]|uniref:373e5e5d-2afe-4e19-bacc-83646e8be347 n=1 Tax=Sclerotinia trifoliorum TaxID=28548 RepID=A0A8H2VR85_9HELO|nr:373e5e5d-2afe-4e19-bacc-83646e8be347 [Sclerotinia trifoliorum]